MRGFRNQTILKAAQLMTIQVKNLLKLKQIFFSRRQTNHNRLWIWKLPSSGPHDKRMCQREILEQAGLSLERGETSSWGNGWLVGPSPPFLAMSVPTTCFDDPSNWFLWKVFFLHPTNKAAVREDTSSPLWSLGLLNLFSYLNLFSTPWAFHSQGFLDPRLSWLQIVATRPFLGRHFAGRLLLPTSDAFYTYLSLQIFPDEPPKNPATSLTF